MRSIVFFIDEGSFSPILAALQTCSTKSPFLNEIVLVFVFRVTNPFFSTKSTLPRSSETSSIRLVQSLALAVDGVATIVAIEKSIAMKSLHSSAYLRFLNSRTEFGENKYSLRE